MSLMNESAAAQYLALSERSLRKFRTIGELPYIKLGGAIRYHPDDLDQFIVDRRQKCGSIKEKTRHIGNIASPSTVIDIGDLRNAKKKEKLNA